MLMDEDEEPKVENQVDDDHVQEMGQEEVEQDPEVDGVPQGIVKESPARQVLKVEATP